jgi:ParB-like chromosome segregation protein Spo0J
VSPLPKKTLSPQDIFEGHPLALIFPMMKDEEFDAFVVDIKAYGLREPITLYQGRILEGRNRYRACLRAKVKPRFEKFKGNEAAATAFVISRNIHRRHLTPKLKRDLIAKLLKATPEKSDREIGRTIAPETPPTESPLKGNDPGPIPECLLRKRQLQSPTKPPALAPAPSLSRTSQR